MKNKTDKSKNSRKDFVIVIMIVIIIIAIGIILIFTDLVNREIKITPADVLTLTGAAIGVVLVGWRTKLQEKQLDLQTQRTDILANQRKDDRFSSAIALLGSNETSARTGALYALYNLAVEEEPFRVQVAQILCSHIRSKTAESKYQKQHNTRPSNEIQTAIDLLVRNVNGTEGLYQKDFAVPLPPPNFRHAFLAGANFQDAQCLWADFSNVHCQRANFGSAQCQGADFGNAQCQKASFYKIQCQRANFSDTQCQGAYFIAAHCQGAYFLDTQCQEVQFNSARCQGADFIHAQCQGANFRKAKYQGAYFIQTQCQGADFRNAQCQGAYFYRAECQGAYFNDTQCQGAYSNENIQSLTDRIHKPTNLINIITNGELSDDVVKNIETAKPYCSEEWYDHMQEIITQNKGKERILGEPAGIITGILEDSPEIRKIIEELEELKKIRIDQIK